MPTPLTVYAYGNVDALHGIFNAVAMVMGSGDFGGMVRVAIVIGFLVVLTLSAFPGQLQKGINWFLMVAVLTSVMLVPKATVTIEDRLGQQPPVVVDNVPWTLALILSVKSAFGSSLTQLFETAFQSIPSQRALPSELSYLEHGMMFGARLVRSSRDAVTSNLYDQTDLAQYIRNCVLPAVGRNATPNQILDAMDSRAAMATTNNGLAAAYHDPGANWQLKYDGCANVWTALQPRLNEAGAAAVVKAAARDLPELFQRDRAQAVAKMEAALPAIYAKAALADASAQAADIMVQNILINATADAAAMQGASLNDAQAFMSASIRTNAVEQMNADNLAQGRIAEESLPIVRNITEAILVAVFPVLCILLIASEGKGAGALFKSYVYTLVWVELWPAMFAVVNYLQTLEAAKQLSASAYVQQASAYGLTIGNANSVYSTAVSSMATTAWMVTFVPVIAAAVLFGFDRIMTITGATGGGQRAAQSEAANATKGNFSAGNVSLQQQQLMASQSDPTVFKRETLGGTDWGSGMTGQAVLSDFRQARLPVTVRDVATATQGLAQEASASMSAAERHAKASDKSLDAAFGQVQAVVKGHSATSQKVFGFDVTKMSSDGVLESEERRAAEQIAKDFRIADVSTVQKALAAGINGTSGAGVEGLRVSLGLSGTASSNDSEQLQKALSQQAQSLRAKGVQRKSDVVDQFRTNEAFEGARRSNKDATDRVEAARRESISYREQEAAELSRSKQLSAKIDAAERFARENSVDWSNLVGSYARSRGFSVEDGASDPRRWSMLLRDFVESGTLRYDTADGRPMWILPDSSVAPKLVDTATASAVATGGVAGLKVDFDGSRPGGGREQVDTTHAGNLAKTKARDCGLGVDADTVVTAGALPKQVSDHRVTTRSRTDAAGAAIRDSAGRARVEQDKRADTTSDAHPPLVTQNPLTGNRVANKALDGVKNTDGTRPSTFVDEAAEVRVQDAAAAEKFYREAKDAHIPK